MTDQELRKLHEIYTDGWKLLKQYADVKDTDEYWKAFLRDSEAIYEKHGRHPLAERLMFALGVYIEDVSRKGK